MQSDHHYPYKVLIASGLGILFLFLVVLGLSRSELSGAWQPVLSVLLWMVLLLPGILTTLAVVLHRKSSTNWNNAIVSILLATMTATVVSAVPFTFFFAHDAPNNFPALHYYGRMITEPLFLAWWLSIAVVIAFIRWLIGIVREKMQDIAQ